MSSSTSFKTLNHFTETPFVNSAVKNSVDYYKILKEKNKFILNSSFKLAELSLQTFKTATSPIVQLIKTPGNFNSEHYTKIL